VDYFNESAKKRVENSIKNVEILNTPDFQRMMELLPRLMENISLRVQVDEDDR
jgi:hypothetical protein